MEIGDFAILKRELYKLSTPLVPAYIPTEIGRIGRVRNARYSRKFEEEEHLSSLELIFVSDVSGLYFYRLKPNKVELIGNDKETPKRIEGYFEGLRTDSKWRMTPKQRETIDELNKHFEFFRYDLKRAMKDYKILLNADLNVKCPKGDVEKIKELEKVLERH